MLRSITISNGWRHGRALLLGLTWSLLGMTAVVAQEAPPPSIDEAQATAREAETPIPPLADATAEAEAEIARAVDEDRITFDVRLDDSRGGGTVKGAAGSFELQEEEWLTASDGLVLRYKDIVLRADRARIDIPSNTLVAEGNITLDQGPQRLTGESLEYDLDTQTGRLTNATAYVHPDYYFYGSEISKVGPQDFTVLDGTFTSCSAEVPPWDIRLSRANITLDDYAHIYNARIRAKRLPLLYVPYIVWPTVTDRASGFLIPKPGFSENKGAYLGLAYFQTFGRSADATFYADLYSEEFFGVGAEVRYRPSERTTGTIRGFVIDEPDMFDRMETFGSQIDPTLTDEGETRWKLEYFHETVWDKWKAVVAFQDFSDFDYQQDWERSLRNQTRPDIYSYAFLNGDFGQQSVSVLVDRRERISSSGLDDIRHQLPEITYNLRPTKLVDGAVPIYLSVASSLNYFALDIADTNLDYGRFDALPLFTAPLSELPWLSVTVSAGARFTHYTDSLSEDLSEVSGESLNRTFGTGSVEVVGPSFARIYENEIGRFSKFKHIIEPQITYTYVDEFDDQARVLRFDTIDTLQLRNDVVVAIVNRIIAKPKDESEGGAYEIASFSLAQAYNFDNRFPGQVSNNLCFGQGFDPLSDCPDSTQEGPLLAAFRFNPSTFTSLRADATYNTLFNEFQAVSLSGGIGWSANSGIGVTWYRNLTLDFFDDGSLNSQVTNDQLQLFTKFELVKDRLFFDSEVSYDIELSEVLQQRHFLRYESQCYGLSLEVRQSTFGNNRIANPDFETTDVRLSLSLKNVGTFLDISGGTDSF
ncbi:MAG: LPS assembly protein LptD [Acidobacteriota bacterium]